MSAVKANCSAPDKSAAQYSLTPVFVPSQATNRFPFSSHTPPKSFLTYHFSLTHTHTHAPTRTRTRSGSCLIRWPSTCAYYLHSMHMHQSLSKLTPTCFLGSHSASTSTHSTTNESISWYHSFHCCQTPSISPFLTVSTEQRGSSEIESEVRVWNIQTVQRLRVSYLLYSSWIMAFGCRVAVPGWNWRDWRRELDSFWSLCMWSDLAFYLSKTCVFKLSPYSEARESRRNIGDKGSQQGILLTWPSNM